MPRKIKVDSIGKTFEFPDGTPDAVIDKAVREEILPHYAQQQPSQPSLTNQGPSGNQTPPSIFDKAMAPVGDLMHGQGATRDALLQAAGYVNTPGAWLQRKLGIADKYTMQEGEQGVDYANRLASLGPDPAHPYKNALAVGVGGATKDVADLAGSFTSPIALATMGAGAVGKAGKAAQTLVGSGFALKGAKDVVENAPAAMQGDPDAAQKALFGGAMVAGGAAGAKEGIAKGAKAAGGVVARQGVEAVLQPVGKQFRFGKDPTGFVIDNGITANSLEELHNNIKSVVDDKVVQLDSALKQSKATVNVGSAKQVVRDAIQDAMQKRDAATVGKLTELYNRLGNRLVPGQMTLKSVAAPNSIPAWEAAQVKRGIQGSINWADSAEKPINDVKLRVQHVLGDNLHQAVPETALLDESVSSGIEAQKAAEKQWLNEQAGRRTVKNGTRIPLAAGAIGGLIGGPAGVAAGATVGRVAVQGLGQPAIGTRLGRLGKP